MLPATAARGFALAGYPRATLHRLRRCRVGLRRSDAGRAQASMGVVVAVALGLSACSGGSGDAATSAVSSTATTVVAESGTHGTDAAGTPTTGAVTTGSGGTSTGPTSSAPPTGSGATVDGVTPTTPPPLVPNGATKTESACRQIYSQVTTAVTAWNVANRANRKPPLRRAAAGLTKAATGILPIARASGDRTLLRLTTAVSTQLRKAALDLGAGRDVEGAALNQSTSALWTYCRSPR